MLRAELVTTAASFDITINIVVQTSGWSLWRSEWFTWPRILNKNKSIYRFQVSTGNIFRSTVSFIIHLHVYYYKLRQRFCFDDRP